MKAVNIGCGCRGRGRVSSKLQRVNFLAFTSSSIRSTYMSSKTYVSKHSAVATATRSPGEASALDCMFIVQKHQNRKQHKA